MAASLAWSRRVRRCVYLAIVSGMGLTGCGGGGDSQSAPGRPIGTATDTTIALSWTPSPDPVEGYIVYSGPAPDAVTTLVTSSTSPNIRFNAGTDLSLSHGERVCFRVRAYIGAQESEPSEPACTNI